MAKYLTTEMKGKILRNFFSQSVTMDRSKLAAKLGKQFGGDRELYDILGYEKNLTYDHFYARYVRQDIAKRIISMPPQATWRNTPTLVEEKEIEQATDFERQWEELNKRLRVLHYLERADKLAGIGKYSILLIGVANGGKLSTELKEGSVLGPEGIIYLKPYGENRATIEEYEENTSNPRFGKPKFYSVDMAGDLSQVSFKLSNVTVHHSRVIHIAEDLLENDIFGTPRLEAAFNLLEDLLKVVGGSAEMFWQGASRGIHVDVNPDASLGQLSDDELEDLATEIDEYIHGLRRVIRTQGASVETLKTELGDPSTTFDAIISLISGATGIPKRILIGSERGELASTQDEQNWASYIRERRDHYAEPIIFRPLIDKFIELGALADPSEGYVIKWPPLAQLTQVQQAQVAESYARAIRFASGNKATKEQLIVSESEFRTNYLGLSPVRLGPDGMPVEDEVQIPESVEEEQMGIEEGDGLSFERELDSSTEEDTE